jgi:hypothetical protein
MSFFASLVALDAEDASLACKSEVARLDAEIKTLTVARLQTPRGDKKGANDLLIQIQQATAERRRVVEVSKVYRVKAEAQQSHGLWVMAVRQLAGQEVLTQCYEWMKAEKRRRATVEG